MAIPALISLNHLNIEVIKDLITKSDDEIRATALNNPKAGEVYVVQVNNGKDDWRADGYRWKQNGRSKIPRGLPLYTKLHFATVTPTGTSCVFQKFVYRDLSRTDVVVVHYIGNHELAILMPHGNCRKSISFLPTAPTLRDAIIDSDNYKDLLVDTKHNQIQFQPRNSRQLKYVRSVKAECTKLGTESFLTIHELAYMIPGFVWSISTYPDLSVLFGMQNLIDELVMCPQIFFSYDTTFNLGDFYLSILVAQMSCFNENPCMPIAFVLHDRKLDNVHKHFFKTFKSKLPIFNQVVIVTDGESGMSKAIKKVLPKWNLVSCSNHIISDVDFWLKKHNACHEEIIIYKSQMQELLRCESELHLKVKIDTLRLSWSEAFSVYFSDYLYSRILIAYIGHLRSVGLMDNIVTNNVSESLNAVIKKFQEWKEAPVDSMIVAMHRLQTFYLTEIKRSCSGFGPYTLFDSSLLINNTDDIPKVDSPELVIAELQAAASSCKYTNAAMHTSIYTISAPDGNAHVVKLYPKENCTCPSSTICCHILAVKCSIGIECGERKIINLTKLRRNSRYIKLLWGA
nr:uncharacterized protein LOC124805788 [Hydra vulgaris]